MNHEEEFVRSFILKDKQERYLLMLSSKNKRSKILDSFNHNLELNPKHVEPVPSGQKSLKHIHDLLISKGAGKTCYVISCCSKWDAKEMELEQALHAVIGSNIGTVVCCVPGKLAYYEAEDMKCRYILCK